jgi:ribosomal protein S1
MSQKTKSTKIIVEEELNPGINAEKIIREISSIVSGTDVTYIDALVHYAEINDIEIQLVGEIVKRSQVLKAKVAEDAERLRLIDKVNRLPL